MHKNLPLALLFEMDMTHTEKPYTHGDLVRRVARLARPPPRPPRGTARARSRGSVRRERAPLPAPRIATFSFAFRARNPEPKPICALGVIILHHVYGVGLPPPVFYARVVAIFCYVCHRTYMTDTGKHAHSLPSHKYMAVLGYVHLGLIRVSNNMSPSLL